MEKLDDSGGYDIVDDSSILSNYLAWSIVFGAFGWFEFKVQGMMLLLL